MEFGQSAAGAGVVRFEAERLGELRGRLVATSQRGEHVAEGDSDLRPVRTEVHGRGELFGGVLESPTPCQGHAE